jgi:hypothetical protein
MSSIYSNDCLLLVDVDQCFMLAEDSGDMLYSVGLVHSMYEYLSQREGVESSIDRRQLLIKAADSLVNPRLVEFLKNAQAHIAKQGKQSRIAFCTAKGALLSLLKLGVTDSVSHTRIYSIQSKSVYPGVTTQYWRIPGESSPEDVMELLRSKGDYATHIQRTHVFGAVLKEKLNLDYVPDIVIVNGSKCVPELISAGAFGLRYNPYTTFLVDDRYNSYVVPSVEFKETKDADPNRESHFTAVFQGDCLTPCDFLVQIPAYNTLRSESSQNVLSVMSTLMSSISSVMDNDLQLRATLENAMRSVLKSENLVATASDSQHYCVSLAAKVFDKEKHAFSCREAANFAFVSLGNLFNGIPAQSFLHNPCIAGTRASCDLKWRQETDAEKHDSDLKWEIAFKHWAAQFAVGCAVADEAWKNNKLTISGARYMRNFAETRSILKTQGDHVMVDAIDGLLSVL